MKKILGKGVSALIKGHLCLTKRHLDNPGGRWRSNPPNRKLFFDTFDSNKEKHFFPKKALFTEAFYPQKLYLSEIGTGIKKGLGKKRVKSP